MSAGAEVRERALEVALAAGREAGELLLGHLGRLDAGAIRSKSARRDLVTEADVASERLLVERLRAAFPDHAIEAEEEVRDARLDDRPRWFLDPLDGTINFVHSLPPFAVSLGLFFDGLPQVGVVVAPRLGEVFAAVRGGGARLLDAAGDWASGRELAVSDVGELADAVLVTGFPYRRNELANPNLGNFCTLFPLVRGLRRFGAAALDLAYTAAGRFDGYWELHLSPHDTAAGALLVTEAGGLVTDLGGGDDWLRSGKIVAAGPAIHRELLARLED